MPTTLVRWQQLKWPVSRVKRLANGLNRRRWRCHGRGVDFAVKLCSFFLFTWRVQWPQESNEWEVRARAKRITGRLLPAARPLKPLAAVRLIGHWPWALKYFRRFFSSFTVCQWLSPFAPGGHFSCQNRQTPSFPRNPLYASIYLKWTKFVDLQTTEKSRVSVNSAVKPLGLLEPSEKLKCRAVRELQMHVIKVEIRFKLRPLYRR